MCLEDIRIGRTEGYTTAIKSVGAAALAVLATADEKRTRLVVSCDGVQTVLIGPAGLAPAVGTGIALTAGRPVMILRIEDYGLSLTQQWSVFNPGAASTNVSVIDVGLPLQTKPLE